jgi:gluconolactonase
VGLALSAACGAPNQAFPGADFADTDAEADGPVDASRDAARALEASSDAGHEARDGIGDAAPIDREGGSGDAGTYPPLELSAIGRPAAISNRFLFTEGPIWDPAASVLYFTDINANIIYRFTPPSTFDAFIMPSQHANGLALDRDGSLVVAGFSSRSVERASGTTLTAIASTYQGLKLNSPDDVTVRSDGVIYFTDPTFGISGSQGLPAQQQQLSFEGVYRLTTDGTLHLEDQGTSTPNGVELSPDEHTLYVSFTSPGTIAKYAVGHDGALSNRSTFATGVSTADSMCVDAAGNLYVASLGGIAVFAPSGKPIGTIAMSQVPTNCAFGGPDQRTLFITARTSLAGTPTAGNASLYQITGMPIPGLPGRP